MMRMHSTGQRAIAAAFQTAWHDVTGQLIQKKKKKKNPVSNQIGYLPIPSTLIASGVFPADLENEISEAASFNF